MCYGHLPEAVFEQDSIYFMRNTDDMVPLPASMDEARETLPSLFEIGLLNGHSLVMLEQVITQVFMPLLSYNQHRHNEPKSPRGKDISPGNTAREATQVGTTEGAAGDKAEETPGKDSAAKAMLRDEFLINMQKFASSITRTIQQIEGEVSDVG